jgi:hypothetical protein
VSKHKQVGGVRNFLGGVFSIFQWLLVTFQGGFWSIVPPSTWWDDACLSPSHDRVLVIIFFFSDFFFLLHLKRCLALQNCRVILYLLIVLNLIFFSIPSINIYFLCFFNQIRSSFFLFLFILILIFFLIGFYFSF